MPNKLNLFWATRNDFCNHIQNIKTTNIVFFILNFPWNFACNRKFIIFALFELAFEWSTFQMSALVSTQFAFRLIFHNHGSIFGAWARERIFYFSFLFQLLVLNLGENGFEWGKKCECVYKYVCVSGECKNRRVVKL